MKINYKGIIVLLFIATMLTGCMTAGLIFYKRVDPRSFQIREIVVRDSNFDTIRIIDQPEQIREINRIWKELKQINEVPTLSNMKWIALDIKANNYEDRWFYSRQGYLEHLSIIKEPMFKVEDPAAFNKLIFDSNSMN